ncbi:hypothetical protein [Sporisorium scitamineum]|uniref:Cytochrome c oxidase subunit 6, mitochondrial n=1 Tax=Sporisorium scitamineum TaxID=49012 RepID=A0A0F7S2Y7_9BASI|nr:hypothetical protein [Sporisorium scitamineum]
MTSKTHYHRHISRDNHVGSTIFDPACIDQVLDFYCCFRGYAAHHEEESFDAFNTRYVGFFDAVEDLFELQRGLNNCFAYDLVPSPEVIESALRASRRVNDYSTAVRIFEGIKQKVENENQYKQYVDALKGVREELGIQLKEELYSA